METDIEDSCSALNRGGKACFETPRRTDAEAQVRLNSDPLIDQRTALPHRHHTHVWAFLLINQTHSLVGKAGTIIFLQRERGIPSPSACHLNIIFYYLLRF